ncbi:hypothetical protein DFH08DRAFT_724782 [Mycena albidolilacea]|uniref:Reverse transcriptase zinc-binding domain-containing protein n=1 Tax=Mycena albidolilacea TaxID=1033008 RepID=A0AAD7E6R0_9AGAR|nr:hypothetical protein DFH08DRAFT_724782 [Mycena albidolilacea]
MPLWHHPEEGEVRLQGNNGPKAKCLQQIHSVLTVGEGVETAGRLQDNTHESSATCLCDACEEDKAKGCKNPHVCAEGAKTKLDLLHPEWDPRRTNERQIRELFEDDDGAILFQLPQEIESLGQGLRTLTTRIGEPREGPRPVVNRRRTRPIPGDTIIVHIGGATLTRPRRPPQAAASVVFGRDNPRNISLRVPKAWTQSTQVAELTAILEAIRSTDSRADLTIISMQDSIGKTMSTKLTTWENEGWVGVRHRELLRAIVAELKARKVRTKFVVAGPGTEARTLCQLANKTAKTVAACSIVPDIQLDVPAAMALPGVQLQGNKQKIFYRGIREVKAQDLEPRPSTEHMLENVKRHIKQTRGRVVTDEDIWKSLQHKDFLPRTAQFLWRSMHNAHRVGHYWTHIPECQEWAICQECGETEDLKHILTTCNSPGAELIWSAAEKLWREKEPEWPEISIESILGCGLVDLRDESGKKKRGSERMYRILISESAYTIWMLRNDRVISRAGSPIDEAEITNKWLYNLNQRLQQDILLANRPTRRNRPRLPPNLVRETWSGTLDNESNLPEDWLKDSRVLVGRWALTQDQPRSRRIGDG